jgi:hypothetical protein
LEVVETFSFEVVGVNVAPEWKSSAEDVYVTVNGTYSVTLPAWEDADTPDTFTVDLEDGDGSLPSFVTSSDNILLEITPLTADVGEYQMTYRVTDSNSGLCECGKN